MKPVPIQCVLIMTILTCAMCSTYFFGEQTANTKLVYRDKVKYEAFPLKKRIKEFTYNGTLPIKVIITILSLHHQPIEVH